MKKSNLILLSMLIIAGCSNTTTSSSSLSNSSSSSTSSTIDTTGWIEKGEESVAITNSNNWIYNSDDNVKMKLAMTLDSELYFNYEKIGTASWNSLQLFYHKPSIDVGETYKVSFSISSSNSGSITVNGEVFNLNSGSNSISVSRVLPANSATLSIQFGTESTGFFADSSNFVLGNVQILKRGNAKKIIEKAISCNNYTIELTEGQSQQTGTYKFFEKGAIFKHYVDYGYQYRGFGENEEGILGINTSNGETFSTNWDYFRDKEGNVVKGLYSTREVIDFDDNSLIGQDGLGESKGIPSLHHLDLSELNLNLIQGQEETISDGYSFKVFARMAGQDFNQLYYSGVINAKVTINVDGNLEFSFDNRYSFAPATFVLKDIGTTTYETFENFVSSDKFKPNSSNVEVDETITEMLKAINGNNYTVVKPDGTYHYINENYSYHVTSEQVIDENGDEVTLETIGGYIKLSDGIYSYTIVDDVVTIDEETGVIGYDSIGEADGFGSVSYFKNAIDYTYNSESEYYEMEPSSSNMDCYSFSTKWYGQSASKCSLVSIKYLGNNIKLNTTMTFMSSDNSEIKSLMISEIGSTEVEFMENYLDSLKA